MQSLHPMALEQETCIALSRGGDHEDSNLCFSEPGRHQPSLGRAVVLKHV